MVDFFNASATQRTLVLSLATCLIAVSFAGCRCRQPGVPPQYTPYNSAPPCTTPGCNTQPFNTQPFNTQPFNTQPFNTAPAYNQVPNYNTAPTLNNGFGFNNANGRLNAGSQSRIPAPATYSLNIPGVNNNANNNINGTRVGQLPSGLLNTRQNAPTPANQPANFNQTQGWRQSNGNDLNTSSTGQPGSSNRVADASSATSVLESSTRINNSSDGPTARTASLNGGSGTGVSFTRSNDYQTTSIDERRDNTRLPITDATNVRATTPFAQNQSGSGQYVQPYYQPRQQNQQPFAPSTPTTYRGAFVQPNAQPGYVNFNGLPQSYQGRFAQQQSPAAQPQRQVLAQSTARFDPFESTASAASSDWRDRGRQAY